MQVVRYWSAMHTPTSQYVRLTGPLSYMWYLHKFWAAGGCKPPRGELGEERVCKEVLPRRIHMATASGGCAEPKPLLVQAAR